MYPHEKSSIIFPLLITHFPFLPFSLPFSLLMVMEALLTKEKIWGARSREGGRRRRGERSNEKH
jgi:hypothetical protein